MTFVHVHIETSALPHRHRCNVAIGCMQCDSPAVSAKRGRGGKRRSLVFMLNPGMETQMCGAGRLSVP